MDRRDFTLSCLGGIAAMSTAAFTGNVSATPATSHQQLPADPTKPHIAFVIYDGMTAQDLIGPVEVLANSHFNVDFVWRDKNPVFAENRANRQLGFLPTATFNELQHTDILFVPGTSNPYLQMRQQDMVDWVAQVGAHAKWVTSVCSGSFILGAAGLLKGYQVTSHWALRDNLRYFGAQPVAQRVVRDRNRVTGAGVTSGIDFALQLLALLTNEQLAQATELTLEYDPQPPYHTGSPKVAPAALVEASRNGYLQHLAQIEPDSTQQLLRTAKRLGVQLS